MWNVAGVLGVFVFFYLWAAYLTARDRQETLKLLCSMYHENDEPSCHQNNEPVVVAPEGEADPLAHRHHSEPTIGFSQFDLEGFADV